MCTSIFGTLNSFKYRESQILLLVYDLMQQTTFQRWRKFVMVYCQISFDSIITVLKHCNDQDIQNICDIKAMLYPVNLTLTKIDHGIC